MQPLTVEDLGYSLPIRSFRCPFCLHEVHVQRGLSPGETMWMHEYECSGIVLAFTVH